MVVTTNNKIRSKGKLVKTKINFDLPVSCGSFADCENVVIENNVLAAGRASELVRSGQNIDTFAVSVGKTAYFYYATIVYKYANSAVKSVLNERLFISGHTATVYKGQAIVSFKGVGTYLFTDNGCESLTTSVFSSLENIGERVFALSADRVYYTQTGDARISTSCDCIELPTDCCVLVRLGETLYALGEYCYSLSVNADDSEIKVKRVCGGVGKINVNSVKALNGEAFFTAADGLYRFKQNKISKIFGGLERFFDLQTAQAEIYGDKYVLRCPDRSSVFDRQFKTLVLDVNKEKIVGIMQDGIFSVIRCDDDLLLATKDGEIRKVSKSAYADSVIWKKTGVNFGAFGKKYLRSVTVNTERHIELYISNGTETRVLRVEGKKGFQSLPVKGCGESFDVTVKSRGETKVFSLELTAEIYCEV